MSTLNTTVARGKKIRKNVEDFGGDVEEAKGAKHAQLEKILLEWFKQLRVAGVSVDSTVPQEKADTVATLVHRTVSGEGKTVDDDMVAD